MSLTLLTGARLWDPDSGAVDEDVSLLIEDGVIREVSVRPIKAETARRIEAKGRFVLPGLIDAHVHVTANAKDLNELARLSPYLVAARAKSVLESMLMRGFTTVRDAGGADRGLARAVEEGHFDGPRIFVSGLALARHGGHGDYRRSEEESIGCPVCRGFRSITRLVEDEGAIRAAAREERHSGADQLKIMASGGLGSDKALEDCFFSSAEIAAAVEVASATGSYVMAHAYESRAVGRCVEAGVHSIEHGTLIDSGTAALMADRGSFLVPTLGVFPALREQARAEGAAQARIDRLEALLQRSLAGLDTARSAGVAIGHGSDQEGASQHLQSLEFAVRSVVMSPRECLRAATVTNARIMGLEADLGRLEPGRCADLLVVDGNPLDDIAVLAEPERHLRLIMKDGRCFKNELG
nr:amidohydrolase family protein [Desulfuromonadales bacterium]